MYKVLRHKNKTGLEIQQQTHNLYITQNTNRFQSLKFGYLQMLCIIYVIRDIVKD